MQVTLKADQPAQIIAATGQTVAAGETVDVADDLGRSLCEQTDKWAPARKPKSEGTDTPEGVTKEKP